MPEERAFRSHQWSLVALTRNAVRADLDQRGPAGQTIDQAE
jgi:hypothetical protein